MKSRIYKIKNNINSKEYVGQTRLSLEKRLKNHLRDSVGKNPKRMPIVLAIKKYGIDKFEIILLEELSDQATQQEIDECEIKWGLKLNTLSPNGYNLKLGNSNCILSDETKKKIGNIHRGKIVSLETRKKLHFNCLGRIRPQEERDRISKNNAKFWLGKKRSDEDKKKMSKPKTFINGISSLSKKIIAECNGIIYEFNSSNAASRSNIFDKKIHSGGIIRCCKGKLKSCGKINGKKVYWKYLEEKLNYEKNNGRTEEISGSND